MFARREIRAQAERRLAQIQQQWSLAPATEPAEPARVRFGSWNARSWRALAVLLIGVLLLAGWWWWSGRPATVLEAPQILVEGSAISGTTPAGEAPPMSGRVVVHVVGAVREPGLVELPAGARVADAVEAAGGPTAAKALASVNLARPLIDGEQVVLAADGAPSRDGASNLLSLNQASAAEFEALPGIGPVLAQRIVDWRSTNGSFRSVDELGEVSGIGDALMAQIRPLVRP